MQFHALISIVLLVGAQAAEEVSLPSSIKISECNQDLPNYSDCLKNALQKSWPAIISGVPELSLPVLDPFKIEKMENISYQILLLTSDLNFTNVKAYGLDKVIIEAVRPTRTADRINVEVDYAVPNFFAEGNYEASGGVGFLRVGGQGYFNMSLVGKSSCGLEGRIENDRWIIEHIRVNYPDATEVHDLKVHFDDVFNGNEVLNGWAMKFINYYWPNFYKSMLPAFEEVWDGRLTDLSNQLIFSKLSVSKTFP